MIKASRRNAWALQISPITPRRSVWRGDTGPTSAPQRYRPAAGAWEGQAAEMLAGSAACGLLFCVFRAPLKRGARAELNFAGMDSLAFIAGSAACSPCCAWMLLKNSPGPARCESVPGGLQHVHNVRVLTI